MMEKLLDKCVKTGVGKPIYFTKEQCDYISYLLSDDDPWGYQEEPNGTAEYTLWLDSYNKYVNIIEKEQKGFRLPGCGCRAGYECQLAYVKIRDDVCKIYKRHTGNIHDDRKSIYEWISGYCPQC